MAEQRVWDAYQSSQEKIALSSNLKQAILRHQQQLEEESKGSPVAHAAQARTTNQGSNRRKKKTTNQVTRIVLTLAACLVVITFSATLISFLSSESNQDKGNLGSTLTAIIPDFTVRAYAAESDTLIALGSGNQIIFSRTLPETRAFPKDIYLNEGYYTGCVFSVEGKDMARIQASVSTGVLYRQTIEVITRGKNPEQWSELMGWKPTSRGLGEYYGGYDSIDIWGIADNLPKDSPDKQMRVMLCKKLGSTIDVLLTENTPHNSFGFWINEDCDDSSSVVSLDAAIDLFDGAILTVTVTFTDGNTTTQLIELHTGYVQYSYEYDIYGASMAVITPELIDPETTTLEPYEYARILYGVVLETNKEAFPGRLEAANELEHIVDEPLPLNAEDFELLRPYGTIIMPEDIHPSGSKLQMSQRDWSSENIQYFSISDLVATRSKNLPKGVTLDDLRSGFGSWDYFNRVTSQLDGYSLDESGTPSKGFSWVLLEAKITNDNDSICEITADGNYYGVLAVCDSKGKVSQVVCRSFALLNGGWDTSKPGVHADISINPHETETVRWLIIMPDFAIDDPSLFFLVTNLDPEVKLEGFKLNF